MAKILYPVGTQVTIKGTGPFFVTAYHKGEKFPYRVSVVKGGEGASVNGKPKFSVKCLKRYNPTQTDYAEDTEDKYSDSKPTTDTLQDSFTREEVIKLLRALAEDTSDLIDKLRKEFRTDVSYIAKAVDCNFNKVGKQFKTLSHDDD